MSSTEEILSLFRGRCGHRWIGASGGSFGCPICGDHDGDHHLISMESIAVQVDDWGCAWSSLQYRGAKAWRAWQQKHNDRGGIRE